MPDRRAHRGPHPRDAELFSGRWLEPLQRATAELSWLLSRGYAHTSALELAGDRHQLRQRQRAAVSRCACSEEARTRRLERRVASAGLEELWIDGFNVLLTLEVALGGGVVLRARDECLRDIASVHGTYRAVEESPAAAALLTRHLLDAKVSRVTVLLDAPVSNSGRLAELLRRTWQELAPEASADWRAELVKNPDEDLVSAGVVVASADGAILDRATAWVNLAREVIERWIPNVFLVDLAVEDDSAGAPHGQRIEPGA